MSAGNDDEPVAIVPADLEVEDRIVGPITFRLAGWLATAAAGIALSALCWPKIPVTVLGALVALAGLAGGFARPGQRPLAWWTRPVAAYLHRARARAHTGRRGHRPPKGTGSAEVDCARAGRRRHPRPWTACAAFLGVRLRPWKQAGKRAGQPGPVEVPAKPAVPPPTAAPAAAPAAASERAAPTASEGLPHPRRVAGSAAGAPHRRRALVAAGFLALGVAAGVGGRQVIGHPQQASTPRPAAAPSRSAPSPAVPPAPLSALGPRAAQTPPPTPPAPWWNAPNGPGSGDPFWLKDPFTLPDPLGGAGEVPGDGSGDPADPALPWWWLWGDGCGC